MLSRSKAKRKMRSSSSLNFPPCDVQKKKKTRLFSMLSSATPSPARQPALAPRRRHPVDMLRAVAARAGQARIPNASSSSSFSSSSTLPSSSMPHVLSCRRRHQRRRRRPSIAPSAVPAAYLEDDDEDVSLNVDDLDALTDDELADLLAGRNPSGYSEEELLRKVKTEREEGYSNWFRLFLFPCTQLTALFLRPGPKKQKLRSGAARRPRGPRSRPSTATPCSRSSSRRG